MSDDPTKTDAPSTEQEPQTALYASKENPVVLRPHVYDGIQEYDQKLPNWWLFTFYIMIFWFVVCWVGYYQLDWFRSPIKRIDDTMAVVNKAKDAEFAKLLDTIDNKSMVTEWATDTLVTAKGKATFAAFCKQCHGDNLDAKGENGEPLQGLPLVDGEWKFGGEPMQIFDLIKDGSPKESDGWQTGKIMAPWKNQLSGKAIAEVAAYVISRNKEEFAKFAQ